MLGEHLELNPCLARASMGRNLVSHWRLVESSNRLLYYDVDYRCVPGLKERALHSARIKERYQRGLTGGRPSG